MAKKLERIESGIPGLDKAISGGFIRGHSNLISGSYGTGKSTLALQFLVHGAKKGENGLYITFESTPEDIREAGGSYGWDIKALEDQKKLKVLKIAPMELLNLVEAGYGQVGDIIRTMNIKRLVVDSITTFDLLGKDEYERRKYMLDFVSWLKKNNCTALLTMEYEPGKEIVTRLGVAESLVDSIIVLYHPKEKKKRTRALEILKMRETKHTDRLLNLVISEKGMKIKK